MTKEQPTSQTLLAENATFTPGKDLDSIQDGHNRILVIDDDPDFIEMTKLILCRAGFDVAGASGGQDALEKCTEIKPDVILLDLMMPEMDGYDTYEQLKKITQAPVIVVTASGNRDNAVKSLQLGMEDYISKPFYNPEMIARIKAAIRRKKDPETENIRVFPQIDLTIHFDTREVYLGDDFINLVPRQFQVLSILARHAPKPVPYSTLTEKIWGEDSAKRRAHLKNIIFSMRKQLEDEPANPKLLINYRSMGYRLMTQLEG